MSKRITQKESLTIRKAILEHLVKAHRGAKTVEQRWVNVDEIPIHDKGWTRKVIAFLVRLSLVDTRKRRPPGPLSPQVLEVRVNQNGIWAHENSVYTYHGMQVSLQVPQPVYATLERCATSLGVMRETGRDAGKVPSVLALLRAIVNREEQFVRWIKAVYPEEYAGTKDG